LDDPEADHQGLDGELKTPPISEISNLVGDAMERDSKSPLSFLCRETRYPAVDHPLKSRFT
jgi:hypothetical protein